MSDHEQSTHRPLVFSVVDDDGVVAGIDEEGTLKPGRYKMKRSGFLSRHLELIQEKKNRPNKTIS